MRTLCTCEWLSIAGSSDRLFCAPSRSGWGPSTMSRPDGEREKEGEREIKEGGRGSVREREGSKGREREEGEGRGGRGR